MWLNSESVSQIPDKISGKSSNTYCYFYKINMFNTRDITKGQIRREIKLFSMFEAKK